MSDRRSDSCAAIGNVDSWLTLDLVPEALGHHAGRRRYGAVAPHHTVDACFETLKARGLPVPGIRREKYVSSK